MWNQFFLTNAHFVINVLAAGVMFAMFWLYFDAWKGRKKVKDVPELIGLVLLALGYLASAVMVDSTLVGRSLIHRELLLAVIGGLKILGYGLVAVGVGVDQLLPMPKTKGLESMGAGVVGGLSNSQVVWPIMAAAVGLAYWRRATVGLENHLRPVAVGYFVVAVAELLGMWRLFGGTASIEVQRWTAAYGPMWIAQLGVLMAGVVLLGRWLWRYLTKRLEPQLFMIFTATVLTIFMVTTSVFTALLLKNIQDETLVRLETDVKVLGLALDGKKNEVLSDARVLASTAGVAEAVAAGDRSALASVAGAFLVSKRQSILAIIDDDGQVLARGEDQDRVGDSLSEEPLVKRGLNGEATAGVVVRDGTVGPEVSVRAVVPIEGGGAVLAGVVIDNAFVDGIKTATGLEAAIYGEDRLAATTMTAADGKTRWVGSMETDARIANQVLGRSQPFTGSKEVLGTPFFASFVPLVDAESAPVGMLFVGRPQATVLEAAAASIELTFMAAAGLILVALMPAHAVSRFIAKQLT